MKWIEVECTVLRKGDAMIITFPKRITLRGELFVEFLKKNGLEKELVIFSPSLTEGEKKKLLVPMSNWTLARQLIRAELEK